MKKHMNVKFFFYLLFIVPLLSGCWDQTSIERRAYVVAVGLDKGEEENQIIFTYLITNPELSKQQGGSTEQSSEIISFPANDIATAKGIANAVIAKDVSYNLLEAFIVSEELAREENFIRWMYDTLKEREIKSNVNMIVTKEEVSQYLMENKPLLESRMHKYFELILQFQTEKGSIPDSDLESFFRITETDADLFLAVYSTTEVSNQREHVLENRYIKAGDLMVEGKTNKTQFLGSAVFKEGKMIGTLSGLETRLTVVLNDTLKMEDILTFFPDPFNDKYFIGARVMKEKENDVKMNLKREVPTIDVTIPLYMEILANHSMEDIENDKEKTEQLKVAIKEDIEGNIEDLVKKTQEEWQAEPFGWSIIARKEFLTIPEFEDFDWMKTYPNMRVNVNVDIRFGEFGRQGDVPDLHKVRD